MSKGIAVKGNVMEGVISSCSVNKSHPRSRKDKNGVELDVRVRLEPALGLDLNKVSTFFVGDCDKKNRQQAIKIGISLLKLMMEAQNQGLSLGLVRNGHVFRELGYIKGSFFNHG